MEHTWICWDKKGMIPAAFKTREQAEAAWTLSTHKLGPATFSGPFDGLRTVSVNNEVVGYYRKTPTYNDVQHL